MPLPRLRLRRLATALLVAVALAGASGLARAQEPPAPARHVDVIEVSGLLDPVLADFLTRALGDATSGGAEALIVQLNSSGSLLGAAELAELVARVRDAGVPVAVWVGPSGAVAGDDLDPLLAAADVVGLAPGSKIRGDVKAALTSPVLGQFLVDLDGRTVAGVELDTADIVRNDGRPGLRPNVQPRFAKLGLGSRLMHTVASPAVAYLLLTFGMSLLIFELFTGGVGVAGGTGAVLLILSAYGLAVLPTNPWGLVLLGLGGFGFAVDIQVGAPRLWTGVGVVAFVAGSLVLFDGPVTLGWLPLLAGVVGMVLMMVTATPAVTRSRFSTPTIGREWMIGQLASAEGTIDPEGTVRLDDALWRARTNRATPIAAGARARIIGIEGIILEVEPEEGGARDYRA